MRDPHYLQKLCHFLTPSVAAPTLLMSSFPSIELVAVIDLLQILP
jgi:hypothetical protein